MISAQCGYFEMAIIKYVKKRIWKFIQEKNLYLPEINSMFLLGYLVCVGILTIDLVSKQYISLKQHFNLNVGQH